MGRKSEENGMVFEVKKMGSPRNTDLKGR